MISVWLSYIGWVIVSCWCPHSLVWVFWDWWQSVSLWGDRKGKGRPKRGQRRGMEVWAPCSTFLCFSSPRSTKNEPSQHVPPVFKQALWKLWLWKFNQENLFLASPSCLWLDSVTVVGETLLSRLRSRNRWPFANSPIVNLYVHEVEMAS